MKCLFFLLTLCAGAEPVFREDFREVPPHIPATSADLTSPFLTLERLGPGTDLVKLSFHEEIPNDPHYLWNGECKAPVFLSFPFQHPLDLTDDQAKVVLQTKNVGKATLHLAVKSNGEWFAQSESVARKPDWNEQTLLLHGGQWRSLDARTVVLGDEAAPDFSEIAAIGFAAPQVPARSDDCIRLDWFELHASSAKVGEPAAEVPELPEGAFLESKTPFLRTALLVKGGESNATRRGVLLWLGHGLWGCFDTDLLRWSAIWKTKPGQLPLSLDSMASASYPDRRAKGDRPPVPRGELLATWPEAPGVISGSGSNKDPREHSLADSRKPVGALPAGYGRWLGISIYGRQAVLHYEVGGTVISEIIRATQDGSYERLLEIDSSVKPLAFALGEGKFTASGEGVSIANGFLRVAPSNARRVIAVSNGVATENPVFPDSRPAIPIFPDEIVVKNPAPEAQGPFAVRNLVLPSNNSERRAIRPTDIDFYPDGTALLTTLDGDVWQVADLESESARWTRVATGLFEPMNIEIDSAGEVFTLGRDQITQLVDRNGDGHFDIFRNISDQFIQTMMPRDYSLSFERAPDGFFLVAKGGINNIGAGENAEMSEHRGTILRIDPAKNSLAILADGLRMPYVGLRDDGAIFASDQQGHFIPSSPIHRIGGDQPYLGFEQTNFRAKKEPDAPLFWYPYQTNRSGAGFVQLGDKAFDELAGRFLHISWNGSLFAIETPENGRPFSWKLPLQLDFPSLNGAVHPVSGQLYLVGIGISAYKPTTPREMGFVSIAQSSELPVPESLEVTGNRVHIAFTRPLTAEETLLPATPALRMFNLRRTKDYGSGHYRWDDKPGEHHLQPTGLVVSSDRRTLDLAFESLHRSDVFDLALDYRHAGRGTAFSLHYYTLPHNLKPAAKSDLARLEKEEQAASRVTPGDARRGAEIFLATGCTGCHSLAGEKLTGPQLTGIGGKGEAYLRESILEPAAKIAEGFEPSMPSFAGVLTPQDLEDLVAYLKSLEAP